MSFAFGLVMGRRGALDLIAVDVQCAVEIGDLRDPESRPRRRSAARAAIGLVERMARWEIHPPALIDHRRLQRLRQLDQARNAAGVRAVRSATITGFSAATSSRAASATAPESPCGGSASVSFGMCVLSSAEIGFSCSSPSATSTTGIVGGVIAIL